MKEWYYKLENMMNINKMSVIAVSALAASLLPSSLTAQKNLQRLVIPQVIVVPQPETHSYYPRCAYFTTGNSIFADGSTTTTDFFPGVLPIVPIPDNPWPSAAEFTVSHEHDAVKELWDMFELTYVGLGVLSTDATYKQNTSTGTSGGFRNYKSIVDMDLKIEGDKTTGLPGDDLNGIIGLSTATASHVARGVFTRSTKVTIALNAQTTGTMTPLDAGYVATAGITVASENDQTQTVYTILIFPDNTMRQQLADGSVGALVTSLTLDVEPGVFSVQSELWSVYDWPNDTKASVSVSADFTFRSKNQRTVTNGGIDG